MVAGKPGQQYHDDIGREVLLGTNKGLRYGRRFFGALPSAPRCKLCSSPFHGVFGPVMRMVGKAPWPANPKYCSACFKQLAEHPARKSSARSYSPTSAIPRRWPSRWARPPSAD